MGRCMGPILAVSMCVAERHETHVESRDVAVVAGRQERGRSFDRGVCERVRRREFGRGKNVQVGTSSSSSVVLAPSTSMAMSRSRSSRARRLRSRSVRSRSRSWPRTFLRFLVRRLAFLEWAVVLKGRGRLRKESCSARVCGCDQWRARASGRVTDGRVRGRAGCSLGGFFPGGAFGRPVGGSAGRRAERGV